MLKPARDLKQTSNSNLPTSSNQSTRRERFRPKVLALNYEGAPVSCSTTWELGNLPHRFADSRIKLS